MKIKAILVLVLSMILVAGCGSDTGLTKQTENYIDTSEAAVQESATESETEATEDTSPDLTGMWIQESSDGKSYAAAVVKEEGVIGVFFVTEGEKKPWTYWIGTYDLPVGAENEFTWVSENTYEGSGVFASHEESKEFAFRSGRLSFTVTHQGKSATVTLVRGEWDTSEIPDSVFGSVKSSQVDVAEPVIKDYDWFVKDGKWVCFCVDIFNPNKEIALVSPAIRITARDKEGELLGTRNQSVSIIYPEQEYVYGTQAFSVDEIPETVEIEVLGLEDRNLKKASLLDPYIPLEVVNATVRDKKIVGEIHNPNDADYEAVAVTAVCKNAEGEIIDIVTEFVTDVEAGATVPFSKSTYVNEEIANIDCYANQWIR